jgi:hypothetical protein
MLVLGVEGVLAAEAATLDVWVEPVWVVCFNQGLHTKSSGVKFQFTNIIFAH